MKIISKLLLVILVILVAGFSQIDRVPQNSRVTITGSGNLSSREVALSGFDQVEAGLTFDITIHQGERFSVVLTSDDNFVEYLQVEQSGPTISFGFKPGYAYDISGVTLQAEVILPELVGLYLNGSSHAALSGFDVMENFSAELTGSSSLSGAIQAQTTNLNVYGNSFVKLTGTGKNLLVDACGAGAVDLTDYRVEDATLQVACSSTVIVYVDGKLNGDAAQNAQVYFVGNPVVSFLVPHESASIGPK